MFFCEMHLHSLIMLLFFKQGTSSRDDEIINGHVEPAIGLGKISEQKGILGPGPADLRFPEAL